MEQPQPCDDVKLFNILYALVYNELPEFNGTMIDSTSGTVKALSNPCLAKLNFDSELNLNQENYATLNAFSIAACSNTQNNTNWNPIVCHSSNQSGHHQNESSDTTTLNATSIRDRSHNHFVTLHSNQDDSCSYAVEGKDDNTELSTGKCAACLNNQHSFVVYGTLTECFYLANR
jgi:hypothetical protein